MKPPEIDPRPSGGQTDAPQEPAKAAPPEDEARGGLASEGDSSATPSRVDAPTAKPATAQATLANTPKDKAHKGLLNEGDLPAASHRGTDEATQSGCKACKASPAPASTPPAPPHANTKAAPPKGKAHASTPTAKPAAAQAAPAKTSPDHAARPLPSTASATPDAAKKPPPPVPDRVDIGVLHGFRALFVLFVCNFHIWQQGWLGQYATVFGVALDFDFWTRASYVFVDGMILMSGFLLYLPHARRAVYQTPVPTLGRFYVDRVARIVPSYLFSVLVMLVFVALPQGAYRDGAAMRFDILTHLTFTFTFFRETYVYTPLNVVLWTVAIELQFYLIFPLLARAMRKSPAITLSLMGAAGIAFRTMLAGQATDLTMLLNQMPAFLDVYALGMLGAILYVRLDRRLAALPRGNRQKLMVRTAAVALFALGIYALQLILQAQSTNGLLGHDQLRLSQWALRLPLAVTLLFTVLSAAFMPRLLQKPLDNRLMRFLATISFNLYIWHQALSVLIARGLYPASLHSDPMLQQSFTLLCYTLSIVVAMAATYGVEQPAARLIKTRYGKYAARKGENRP